MSTGSTEPKALFSGICRELGLQHDSRASKPELAQMIVEAAGLEWDGRCWSRGSTVTLEGLLRVERAAKFLRGDS
jgi:hypothetical protein